MAEEDGMAGEERMEKTAKQENAERDSSPGAIREDKSSLHKDLERFYSRLTEQLLQAGDELRGRELPPLTEELFSLYERVGDRRQYEAVYFLRRKFLSVFGILARLEHRPEDIRKLEEVMEEICREECWALPAHVDRAGNPDWRLTVELFASETAQALSELCVCLETELRPELTSLVRAEVFRRVLRPFLESEVPFDWWEGCTMNWCAVCCGSIGSAALWVLRDQPEQLDRVLKRVTAALSGYLSGFARDGACLEGPRYYSYGMSFYVLFARQLEEYSVGELRLLEKDEVLRAARAQQECCFSSGRTVSFSDGESRERFRVGLFACLARTFPELQFPDFSLAADLDSDSCYRYALLSRDLTFTREYLQWMEQQAAGREDFSDQDCKPAGPVSENSEDSAAVGLTRARHSVFPDAQWSICESESGCAMAAKGGHNDEPHNHNDVGSFLYLAGSEMFLEDLGAGEYTRDYMHEGRYKILCNRSLGHNVPLIGGMEQQAGRQFACSSFEADGQGHTRMRLDRAYPVPEQDRFWRTLDFDLKTGRLTVTDQFETALAVTENLVSRFYPQVTADGYLLTGQEGSCRICCLQGKDFEVTEEEHREPGGRISTVYRMHWEIPASADRKAEIRISGYQNKGKEREAVFAARL